MIRRPTIRVPEGETGWQEPFALHFVISDLNLIDKESKSWYER
jgi:hypothetical protein